jgi:hypothetical protein
MMFAELETVWVGDDLEAARAQCGGSKERSHGLAFDAIGRRRALSAGMNVSPGIYDPWDYENAPVQGDFKSSSTGNFSVSNHERSYLRTRFLANAPFEYFLAINDLDAQTTTVLGTVDACVMYDLGLIKISQFQSWWKNPVTGNWTEEPGWYLQLEDIEKFIRP